MEMKLADYMVTETGFGADLGVEKFLDIKCRMSGIRSSAVILVATIKALKYNGGIPKTNLQEENLEALENGIPNLLKHSENITNVYHLPAVVAINTFPTDTEAEIGLGQLPICMAKNQYSLTDDAKKLGRPSGFCITIRDITASAGAGFLVALTGDIMKMPGLPKVPAAEKIDVDADGTIHGLF